MAQVSLGYDSGSGKEYSYHLVYGIGRSAVCLVSGRSEASVQSTETSPLPRMEAIRKLLPFASLVGKGFVYSVTKCQYVGGVGWVSCMWQVRQVTENMVLLCCLHCMLLPIQVISQIALHRCAMLGSAKILTRLHIEIVEQEFVGGSGTFGKDHGIAQRCNVRYVGGTRLGWRCRRRSLLFVRDTPQLTHKGLA